MFPIDDFEQRVAHAAHLEQLQDILIPLFCEMAMWALGDWDEITGFEAATDDDLHYVFYRTVDEMIIMWCSLLNILSSWGISLSYVCVYQDGVLLKSA